MIDEGRHLGFDPYRPLEQGLQSGDAINRWILMRPRERQEFMRSGGLLAWIQKQGQPVEAEYRFLGGTVAVVVTGAEVRET